jgi:hypothetical protein
LHRLMTQIQVYVAPVALAQVVAVLAGCPPNQITANASDTTPPSALWVQADVPGRPLANVYLNGGPLAAPIAATQQASVTARTDDPDGGIKAIRLFTRPRRPRPGTQPLASFALASQTVSSATAGQPAPASASVSSTLQASPLTNGGWDGGIEIFAEAENYAGQISRSPVLSLCIDKDNLRVHVIPLRDDDGGHAPQVTATQFADALQRANRAFCGTGIQFQFDSTANWDPRKNSGMNQEQTIHAEGTRLADSLPRRVLLLLRWGGDPANPTGNGNAYPPPGIGTTPRNVNDVDQRYVALPSLYPTTGFGFLTLQNGAFLAHELGHYLGLYHTFPGWDGVNPVFSSNPTTGTAADQATVSYIRANGGAIDALDGDAMADTPPDPGPILYQQRNIDPCQNPSVSVSGQVAGQTFSYPLSPDVANAMSYYGLCDPTADPRPRDFSPDQVQRMHLALTQPPRNNLVPP